MKRISFIITYYNEPLEMLTECVRSVLALPLHPGEREILLIDDGSTVPAPEYDGITVVRQENQGLSAARNKGLDVCTGELICFVDSDDWLDLRMIEKLVRCLQENDADAAMCRAGAD